jgi:hypothetical protein
MRDAPNQSLLDPRICNSCVDAFYAIAHDPERAA